MNKVRDLVDLSKVYEAVHTQKLSDPKAKFGTKPGKPAQPLPIEKNKEPLKDKASKQPFLHKDSGPENADGFKKEIVDPKVNKGKENVYEPEKFSNNVEKRVKESINNFMNNKSIFDKLYEEVMGGTEDAEALDAQELGIGPSETEGEKSVAEMSSKELIAKALELLQLAHDKCPSEDTGDEEAPSDEFSSEKPSDEGQEDEGEEDGEEQEEGKKEEKKEEKKEVAGEAVDAEEVGTPVVDGEKLSKGLNKVSSGSHVVPSDVSTAGKKAGKGGESKTTDKVGDDGDLGHPLVNMKKGHADSVKGKSNVVNSRIKGNNQPFYNV